MKPDLQAPVTQGPSTVTWRPAAVERAATPRVAVKSSHLAVCLECMYAELFAKQPRARCICAESAYAQQVVFAGRPACEHMAPRQDDDLTLAWCSPGLKAAPRRAASGRRMRPY
jgi:hypothetical protein